MIEKAAEKYCIPKVLFTSRKWRINGKNILAINIDISQTPPHKAPDQNGDYKVYIRTEDQNMLANGVQMKIWKKLNTISDVSFEYSDEAKAILNIIGNFETISLDKLLDQMELSKYKTENILAELIIMKVVKMSVNITSTSFSLMDPDC